MRYALRWIALGALATATAGCAAGSGRINTVSYNGYDPSYVADVATDGALPVRVIGQPAANVAGEEAASQIGDAMTGANFGTQIEYDVYVEPPENGYVLVVRFGGGTPAGRLCGGAVDGGVGPEYAMAFCKDGHALSYLSGVSASADVTSEAFRHGMRIAAIEMFPPQNPELDCGLEDECD